jgi:hypothetical protein
MTHATENLTEPSPGIPNLKSDFNRIYKRILQPSNAESGIRLLPVVHNKMVEGREDKPLDEWMDETRRSLAKTVHCRAMVEVFAWAVPQPCHVCPA